jgi:hypothetical protein
MGTDQRARLEKVDDDDSTALVEANVLIAVPAILLKSVCLFFLSPVRWHFILAGLFVVVVTIKSVAALLVCDLRQLEIQVFSHGLFG